MKNQKLVFYILFAFFFTLTSCGKDDDASTMPTPTVTCTDGIQNGNETGVDCGGSCDPCITCTDGIQNGDETGIDCGGDCPACPLTKAEAIIGIWEVTELALDGVEYFSEFGVRKLYFNFRENMSYESFIISKNGNYDQNPSTYQPGTDFDIEIGNTGGDSEFYNCEFSADYMTVTLTGSNAFETVALLQKVTEDLCANNPCVNTVECLYGYCVCASGFIGEDCSAKLGPAGGIQIYDRGDNTGPFRYIEVSRTAFSAAAIGCPQVSSVTTSHEIGRGAVNCVLINNVCGDLSNDAVTTCMQLVENGFDDWYLPSSEELTLILPYVNEIFGCPEEGTLLLSSHLKVPVEVWVRGINCFSNTGFETEVNTSIALTQGAQFAAIRYYD